MNNELTEFFQDIPVRKVEIDGEWWVSAIDTAKALDYSNPARDARKIISRNIERFEGYTKGTRLVTVENGIEKTRLVTVLNIKGVIAFCLISNMPKAIPFQRWADSILEKHIKAAVRARKQKYGKLTDKTIETRNMETSEWKRHGANGKDYGELTLLEYELLGFDEDKRKGNMSPDELLILTMSNLANVYQLRKIKDKIYKQGIEKVMDKTVKLINGMEDINAQIDQKTEEEIK